MPRDEREKLVDQLMESLDEKYVKLSDAELAELDEAIAETDREAKLGRLIPADAVLEQMRKI